MSSNYSLSYLFEIFTIVFVKEKKIFFSHTSLKKNLIILYLTGNSDTNATFTKKSRFLCNGGSQSASTLTSLIIIYVVTHEKANVIC